uniref:tyrosine-type recombinase/integrase n=1 Tax=Phocaeicola sp. TaxID=2773926 RepID=UPI003AEF4A5A
ELDRPLTPHLFRHTLATLMLQRGTPITEVQKILGHVNINTTMIYAKVSNEDVKVSHMKYAI